MTKDELIAKWRISIAQFETIDRPKTERFGTLVQGFFGIKKGKNCSIVPFVFYNETHIKKLEELVSTFKTDYLGVSFVQHYIHYS